MSPELEGPIYSDVLREVLWGTGRDEVFRMLQTNGITGAPAEEMFRRARHERLALLRGEGIRKIVNGAVLLVLGTVLFCAFWFGLGWIIRPVIVISGLLSALGFWADRQRNDGFYPSTY